MAFNNNGTVDLRSGVLALGGGYTPSPTSQLKLALGGLLAGTQFSQLNLSGAAALAGTLSVSLANNFTPTNGQSFAIVGYGSSTGQFSPLALPPLTPDLRWKVVYGATALTLSVERAYAISSFGKLLDGQFQMNFSGTAGGSAVLQASTDLINWTPLNTNSPFNGNIIFTDAQSAEFTHRFYRVMIAP